MASSSTHTPSASNLPQPHTFVTGHDAEGKAVVHAHSDLDFTHHDNEKMSFGVVYTTSEMPPDLNGDKDFAAHAALAGSGRLGLVNPGGTVVRCVDFSPGYACGMHRTQSLDYGVVLEGSVRMVLDSGEAHLMKRGDVAVQRATQHQWVNASETEWARMMFVLQDCKPLVVAGKEMKEDLGTNEGLLPPSEQ